MPKHIKYDFVIITPGRSGSEHLSETLDHCDDIEMEGEVFNRANHAADSFNMYLHSSWWLRLVSFFFNREKFSKLKLNTPLRYLIRSFLSTKRSNKTVKGFKLTLDQLEAYPILFEVLVGHSCKVIYLNREDRLSQVLSLMKARQTGQYHHRTESTEDKSYIFDIDIVKEHFLEIRKWEEALIQKLEGHSYFSLTYEGLFQNYETSISGIREFLRLSKAANYQYSDLVKTNKKPMGQQVENFEEIKKHVRSWTYNKK